MNAPCAHFLLLWRCSKARAAHVCRGLALAAALFLGCLRAGAAEPLVDLAQVCPTIQIELRYGTTRNTTGLVLYPKTARCMVRQSVAARLAVAQAWLEQRGLGLKIWDAYRPQWVQNTLWETIHDRRFVADPTEGGSMHTRGVAVDATLVDRFRRELRMPTDFDDFTPDARSQYRGPDAGIARNLQLLKSAMGRGGFLGMHAEWWHFTAKDFARFEPVEAPLSATEGW